MAGPSFPRKQSKYWSSSGALIVAEVREVIVVESSPVSKSRIWKMLGDRACGGLVISNTFYTDLVCGPHPQSALDSRPRMTPEPVLVPMRQEPRFKVKRCENGLGAMLGDGIARDSLRRLKQVFVLELYSVIPNRHSLYSAPNHIQG